VIEGWCLTSPPDNDAGNRAAIEITGTSAHVRIEDVQISRHVTLETGILVSEAANVTIADSELDWLHTGVRLSNAENVTVQDNDVSTAFDVAIEADQVEESRIEANHLHRNTVGIQLSSSPWMDVRDNTIAHNGRRGVEVDGAPVRFVNNTVTDTGDFDMAHTPALDLEELEGSLVKANEFRANNDAMKLVDVRDVAIADNTGRGNDQDLVVVHGEDLEITGNDWTTGLRFLRPTPAEIDHEIADNTVDGEPLRYVTEDDVEVTPPVGQVVVADAANVTIEDPELADLAVGIQVAHSRDVAVDDAAIEGALDGIRVLDSRHVDVEEARIEDSRRHAMRAAQGHDVHLRDSTIREAGGMIVYDASEDGLVADNELVDHENKVLFSEAATNLTFRDNLVADGDGNGVKSWSDNTTVAGNTFTGMGTAVIVDGDNSTVQGNLVADNGKGIDLSGERIRAVGNTVRDNDRHGITGTSEHGTVLDNTVLDNGRGISFRLWPGIAIANNTVSGNDELGIEIEGVEDGRVANNTVEDNGLGLLLQTGFIGETASNELRSNEVAGNQIGVLVHGDTPDTTLRDNNVHDSARDGVDASHADQEIDARWNWWGCSEGPGEPGCDAATGDVDADPWLTSPNDQAGRS
jgi:parallel beta-helix repeat protein